MATPTDSRILAYQQAYQAALWAAIVARWTTNDHALQAGEIGPDQAADLFSQWVAPPPRPIPFRDEFATTLMHQLWYAASLLRRNVTGRISVDIAGGGVPRIELRQDWTPGRYEVLGFEAMAVMVGPDASEEEIGRWLARQILPRAPELYAAEGAGVGIVRHVLVPDAPVPFPA